MDSKLNPELDGLVQSQKIGTAKTEHLIELKRMVDRLATADYISPETVKEIEAKYGAQPNIISWGDYFQAEVATAHHHRSDEEFSVICQTIYFDLISSVLIFTGKPDEFFQQVEDEALRAQQTPRDNWTIEDEEKAHLDILANYFREMGLKEKNLTDKDYEWFHGFAAAKAV